MMNLLRRLMHLDQRDPFEHDMMERLKEHEAAIAESIAVREKSNKSTRMLESATLISKLRSQCFAEFEASIRGKNNHV